MEESGPGEEEAFVDGLVGGSDGRGDLGEAVATRGVGVPTASRKKVGNLDGSTSDGKGHRVTVIALDGIKVLLVGVLPLGEQLLELVGPVSGVPEGRGLVPESPLLNRFHAGETGPGDVRPSNGRKSEKGRDLQRLVEKVSNLVKIDNESLANIIGLRSVGESREDGFGRAGRLAQQSVFRTLGQEAREVLAALFKGKAQPNVGWLVSTDGVIFVLSDGGLAKKLKESSQVGSVCKRMVEVDKENEPTLDEEENPELEIGTGSPPSSKGMFRVKSGWMKALAGKPWAASSS